MSCSQYADEFSLHYYSASNNGTNRDVIRKRFDDYSEIGKPVTLLVWAGLPKYKGNKKWQYPSAEALIDSEWWQITEAKNRGWGLELYCIDGVGGNISKCFSAKDKKSVKLRSAVYQLLGAS